MRDAFASLWRNALVRVVVFLALAAVAVWFLYITRGVWFVVVTAFVFAYLLHPLVAWSRQRFHTRWIGFVVSVLLVLVVIGGFGMLFYRLFMQLTDLPKQLPHLIEHAKSVTQGVPGFIRNASLPASFKSTLVNAYHNLYGQINAWASNFLDHFAKYVTGGGLVKTLRSIVSDFVRLLALLALTAYLLADFNRVSRSFRLAVPRPYQPFVGELLEKFEQAVGGYFRGQIVVATVVGSIIGVGLWILGVPLALSLAVLGGIFDLVPYLGPIISITPALLLAAPMGWWTVLGVLIVYLIANQIESHVMEPLVLGRTSRLHPATVIIVLLLGLHFGGILGALLAVPLAGFIKLLLVEYYFNSRFYDGG